jgi:hypothetical protein
LFSKLSLHGVIPVRFRHSETPFGIGRHAAYLNLRMQDLRTTEPDQRSFIPRTGREPCLARIPTRPHHGHKVSAPMMPALHASLPQEHFTKETPANSFRGSDPQ